MLVISTFTADYLRAPLQHLLDLFSPDTPLEISYGDVLPKLAALKTGLQAPPDILIVLVRVKDLVVSIEEGTTLQTNLDTFVNLLYEVKRNTLPIVAALCPSYYEDSLQQSKAIQAEQRLADQLKECCSALITLEDIRQQYLTLVDIQDPINEIPYHIPYQPQFYVGLACLLARRYHFVKAKSHKVIAVDCDDTLWTGAAAAVGVGGIRFKPHNLALQTLLVEQYKAGVLICLVSQNDPEIILQVFEQRQKEMVLNRSHIAADKINYGLKSENLETLAQEFENMELGRFIFIDDSDQECAQIKYALPIVSVVQMPQTLPAFQKLFQHVWALDRGKATEADQQRTQFYQNNAVRDQLLTQTKSQSQSYSQFIQTLSLSSLIEPATTSKHYDRIAQLTENCTQFNLTGHIKISASDIEIYLSKSQTRGWMMEVEDKFGKYGLVCAALGQFVQNIFICEEFFVSCRGFKKELEYKFIQHIANEVSSQVNILKLPFQQTERNIPARKFLDILFEEAGIESDGGNFVFNVQALTQINPAELTEKAVAQTGSAGANRSVSGHKKADYEQISYWTSTLEPLLDQYFIGKEGLSNISKIDLEEGIHYLCKKLLALNQIKPEMALILLGLNSLKATQLAYFLYQQYKVKIAISFLLSEQLTVPSLAQLIRQQAMINLSDAAIAPEISGAIIPASFQQRRLWLSEQNHSERSFDNHMVIPFLSSPFSIEPLQQACQILLNRHEVFRTGLNASSQHSVSQHIFLPEQVKLDFEILTLEKSANLGAIIRKVAREPFTLEKPPLIRFKLLKTDSHYCFVICAHHIIFDALSLKIIVNELSELLRVFVSQPSVTLKLLPDQYRHLAAEQQQKYGETYQTEALDYWFTQLANTEVAQFPPDHTLEMSPISLSARHEFTIPKNLHSKLVDTARIMGVTVNSLMFSVYSFLVGTYANQNHFTILTAVSGREEDPCFQNTVGFFINLLPLAVHLKEDMSFIEYAKTNQTALLTSLKYQHILFERLQQQLQQNGISSPLKNPAFIYQNYPIATLTLGDEEASLVPPISSILYDLRETTHFGDFTLFIRETSESFLGLIEYAKASYSAKLVSQITRNFLYLLEEICQEPMKKIRHMTCICQKQKEYLFELTQIQNPSDDNRGLIEFFRNQVTQQGDQPAVCYGERTLSYRELNQQSDSLAFALLEQGIQENDWVGIYAERSPEFVVAILAILKVGAAYVPIPADYPTERQKYIIEDAKLRVLLHDKPDLIASDSFKVILLNIQKAIHSPSLACTFPKTTASHLAYLMYTSGSTGAPKGIEIRQQGIVRLVVKPNYIELGPEDSIAFASNPAFDAATFEIFGALLNGVRLVIFDTDEMSDMDRLEQKLIEERITILWLTAGLFHYYANHRPSLFRQLSYLLAGGDVLNPRAIEKIFDCAQGHPKHILNGYGPTENTTFTTVYEIADRHALQNKSWVPIGKPINNTSCYVLGKWGQQIPLGARGELYIGGKGLGRYRHPALQEQRFVTVSSLVPDLLYKTEDIVRYDLEGNIVYLGRADDQIKISGNLIVLSEIERHLTSHEAVAEAVVLAKPQADNSKQLFVFYSVKQSRKLPAVESLRFHLNQRLPAFMVPAFYILLETFPLNHNGKIDKNKLLKKEIDYQKESEKEEVTPLTSIQSQIIAACRSVHPNIHSIELNCTLDFQGFHSLDRMSLRGIVHQQFPLLNLPPSAFNASVSPQDIVDLISNSMLGDPLPYSPLRKLKSGNKDYPPLVFIHPASGLLFPYEKLIQSLTSDRICYGIEDPALSDHGEAQNSIQNIARTYLEYIQAQIKGPVILIGYSFGGMLSLEIAHQAEIQYSNLIQGVFLLDTWIVSSLQNEEVREQIKQGVFALYEEIEQQFLKQERVSTDILERLAPRYKQLQELGFAFKPNLLTQIPVVLFKASTSKKLFSGMQDENNYLSKVVPKTLLTKYSIPGDHMTLLENEESINSIVKRIEILESEIV